MLSQRGQECRWNEEEACACVSKTENDLGKERAEILQGLRADIKCLPVTKRGGRRGEMAVVYRSGRRNRASSMSFARNLTILPL